ncbi:NlpC/P60 family protein [Fructilactobacillus florum]|uniref:Peptidoglycan DL-endopeptidase cwlO n=1 Tax=Fructilactobacillus florum DSM 22689 = JCM 16035 TaxID=1423745 RepID=A0A0R2CYG1_9LACO|nr:NlpC/P60 family protein [Fructilactobacillus florum]KRM92483.1 peptidoglycan DL-endopeptidase cwlO [Fructilactobacillus florum DSM 22689 = JCM 16035]
MNNEKLHYKMYKAGKRWMFAGIATLLVSGGVLSGARPVAADTAVATTSTQATTEQSHADSTSAAATTSDSTAQATSEMPASATITSEAATSATPTENTAVATTTEQTENNQQPASETSTSLTDASTAIPASTASTANQTQVASAAVSTDAPVSSLADGAVNTQSQAQPASETNEQTQPAPVNSEPEANQQSVAAKTTTTPAADEPVQPARPAAVAAQTMLATVQPAAAPTVALASTNNVISTGKQYVGTPYVWGGSTPAGFDCSGFTQYVFGKNGISLPRTAEAQYGAVQKISQAQAQAGDLVFFSMGGIYHVGIYLGNGLMLDAQNRGVVYNDSISYFSGQALFGRVGGGFAATNSISSGLPFVSLASTSSQPRKAIVEKSAQKSDRGATQQLAAIQTNSPQGSDTETSTDQPAATDGQATKQMALGQAPANGENTQQQAQGEQVTDNGAGEQPAGRSQQPAGAASLKTVAGAKNEQTTDGQTNKLPQTGQQTNLLVSALGSILVGLSAVLGFRKKNN